MSEKKPIPIITPEDIPKNISPEILDRMLEAFTGSKTTGLKDIHPDNREQFLNVLYQIAARQWVDEHSYPENLTDEEVKELLDEYELEDIKNKEELTEEEERRLMAFSRKLRELSNERLKKKTIELLGPNLGPELRKVLYSSDSVVCKTIFDVFLEDPQAAKELLELYGAFLITLSSKMQTRGMDPHLPNGVRNLKAAIAVLSGYSPEDTDAVGVDTSRLEELRLK